MNENKKALEAQKVTKRISFHTLMRVCFIWTLDVCTLGPPIGRGGKERLVHPHERRAWMAAMFCLAVPYGLPEGN